MKGVTPMDLLNRTHPVADHRISYGSGKDQFGDLWLPSHPGPAPLLVFLHGGWWKSEYDLAYGGHLCSAIRAAGVAVWSIEYRRVGETGGGWPGTFQDVAAGYDFLPTLAQTYPLDLKRVVAAGHSAGGHLAFWLAGRHHVPAGSPVGNTETRNSPPLLPLKGVVALAGAVDLQLTIDLAGSATFAHDKLEVYRLMGGSPSEQPERYLAGDPGHLLPFNVPQHLLQGVEDDQIPPPLPKLWAAKARRMGDHVTLTLLPGADHSDVADPQSAAWPIVQSAILRMLHS
ncbi:MAG: alpha/beta hydrolase [Acidobacteriaceae bacterium]